MQECIPTRVPFHVREERIPPHAAQTRVALLPRALEPLESSILVPAIRVNFGDLVGRRIGKAISQLGESGVRFGESGSELSGYEHLL